MARSLFYIAFLLAIFQAAFSEENDLIRQEDLSKEKLTVAVKILEEDEENGLRKTEVKVNLNVTIEEDRVKVNGKLTELDVLTKYEIQAEIVYSREDIRISPVTVHVMVIRNELRNGGHLYLIEEQVQIIEGRKVEQLTVKVLSIHMNVDGKEYKRTYEMVSFEQSHIKKADVTRYCGQDDFGPQKLPELPDEVGYGDGDYYHGHGRRHKHRGKGFCSRFHKLPLAARVAILVALVIAVLASVMCCAVCCCKKRKGAYKISKDYDFNAEFDVDEGEAEPLPEKLAFDDKEALIA